MRRMENPWTDLCADVAAGASIAALGIGCVMSQWVHPILVDLALLISLCAGLLSLWRNIKKGAKSAPKELVE